MQYILSGKSVRIEWTVMKSHSGVAEDFTRCKAVMFLHQGLDRYVIPTYSENGMVVGVLDSTLPEGVYDVSLLWVKNGNAYKEGWKRPPAYHMRPHPYEGAGREPLDPLRCVTRTRVNQLFAITSQLSEDESDGDTAKFALKTSFQSYAYDGMDAYEIGVLKGILTYGEDEWLEFIANVPEILSALKELKATVATLEQNFVSMFTAVTDNTARLNEVDTAIGEQKSGLAGLKSTVATLQNGVDALTAELTALSQEMDSMGISLAAIQANMPTEMGAETVENMLT